jgi:hypothetical protein
MVEEYTSIMKNEVWDIVPRLEGKSMVSSRWLYKIKHVADGIIEKYKARFVARGFSQKEGVDYEETFAPITRYTSIREVMSLVSIMGWRIHQMDVKTTFLNGIIEEEVYIEQPRGFEVSGKDTHVCKLKRPYMDSSRDQEYGIPGSTDTCRVWASPKVKQIPTYNSYLLRLIRSFWCCMYMTCSLEDQRSSLQGARKIW